MPRFLAFVTGGALFGIKSVGGDAEHIVALDADTVDDRAYDGAGLDGLVQSSRGGSGGLLRDILGRHKADSNTTRSRVHNKLLRAEKGCSAVRNKKGGVESTEYAGRKTGEYNPVREFLKSLTGAEGYSGVRRRVPETWEMVVSQNSSHTNRASNEYGESRTALARMMYLDA